MVFFIPESSWESLKNVTQGPNIVLLAFYKYHSAHSNSKENGDWKLSGESYQVLVLPIMDLILVPSSQKKKKKLEIISSNPLVVELKKLIFKQCGFSKLFIFQEKKFS